MQNGNTWNIHETTCIWVQLKQWRTVHSSPHDGWKVINMLTGMHLKTAILKEQTQHTSDWWCMVYALKWQLLLVIYFWDISKDTEFDCP